MCCSVSHDMTDSVGFGEIQHCGSNKEKPFSIPFPYEGRLLLTNTQAGYGEDLWSARTHSKAWSPWQPALRVPGDPRVEEVRQREEGQRQFGRVQNKSRGQGSHTHTRVLLFNVLQEVKTARVCRGVYVGVCADEQGRVGCEPSDDFVLQQGDPLRHAL